MYLLTPGFQPYESGVLPRDYGGCQIVYILIKIVKTLFLSFPTPTYDYHYQSPIDKDECSVYTAACSL